MRRVEFSKEGLEAAGFTGFVTVKSLTDALERRAIPGQPGVYVVVRARTERPRFVDPGSGGWFKGTDPNVPIETLKAKWVSSAAVVYIGMASKDLHERVGALIRFGQGANVGHKGGRYLWQLADAEDMLVAWRIDDRAAAGETDLLQRFVDRYGAFPFANLRW